MNQDGYNNGMRTHSDSLAELQADLLEAQAQQQQMIDQLIDAKAGYRKNLMIYLQATGR